MNTIDMNQVAGLQAVDAEGNVIGTLSVDDLTNLVANNLVKSTQNQIAAQSVSTLSEASTLAASDEYENTLPVDDNPKSVRTLDAAGNPKQTGINALATVVGGLVQKLPLVGNGILRPDFYNFYSVGTATQYRKITLSSHNGKLLILTRADAGSSDTLGVYVLHKTTSTYCATTIKQGSSISIQVVEDGFELTLWSSWMSIDIFRISNNDTFSYEFQTIDK